MSLPQEVGALRDGVPDEQPAGRMVVRERVGSAKASLMATGVAAPAMTAAPHGHHRGLSLEGMQSDRSMAPGNLCAMMRHVVAEEPTA